MNCISSNTKSIACDLNHTYQDTTLWNPACNKLTPRDGARILHEWGPVYQPNCFHEKQIKIMFILCTSTYCTVVKHNNFDTHDPQLSTQQVSN
jgi:hypothetical protein